jgi:hypothetical protein
MERQNANFTHLNLKLPLHNQKTISKKFAPLAVRAIFKCHFYHLLIVTAVLELN